MASSRITASRIVVLSGDALESSSLIDWHGAAAILIFHVRVLDGSTQCRKLVRFAGPHWRFWVWGRQIMNRPFSYGVGINRWRHLRAVIWRESFWE